MTATTVELAAAAHEHPGLTAGEVSRRIRQPTRVVKLMLMQLEHDGLVVSKAGHYRLSSDGERRFGRLLRELPIEMEDAA